MASRTCWSCGSHSHMTLNGTPRQSATDDLIWWCGFSCDHCGAFSVANWTNAGRGTTDSQIGNRMSAAGAVLSWYPLRIAGKIFMDVPEHIASAADEAHRVFSIGAHRAAILMARAVVEASAKEKGITSGTLAAKIEELENQQHIRPLIRETADEIRFLGNNMAHGDFVVEVTEDEAVDVLFFMDEVLDEVYQAPARVQARKAARQTAKQSPTP